MSTCGYHSPRFSEDIAWLPQWLQPYRPLTVAKHRTHSTGVSSPSCQERQNATVNAAGYSGFILRLSEDEEMAGSTPISSNVSTAKFLYGCAIDAWMLNPNWLFDSLQAGILLPPGKYLIRQRNARKHSSAFGHSLQPKCSTLIFDGVGFLIHGKIRFCSKFSNIIKHGGGQVFVSLQGLVQSLKEGSTSHGIILVASEAGASRHLSHCGLEHDIKTAPASWIIGSLFSGKLIPLKKDRCASFRRIKMPSFHQQHVYDMSQEL